MDAEGPFVGRRVYFDTLLGRWNELRCISVYGMRSIGKSRFVKQLINLVSSENKDHSYSETWIDLRNIQSLRQIYLTLVEKLDISIPEDEDELCQAIFTCLSKTDQNFFIILDNSEDAVDSDFSHNFINLVRIFMNQSSKVKVIITSTSHLPSNEFGEEGYHEIELSPLSTQESKELLQKTAPTVDFGIYLDKIVELCEGLPLALLMTGSELEQDDGLLEPCDMVELLNKCRLKVLSQDLYPIQERIAPMYRQFLNRLSAVLKEKIGILSYIPGTFTLQQATRILDEESEDSTLTETIKPILQRHVAHIQYYSPTHRFDIHGILRDCITEFMKIQNLPEIRTRYCKMFAELMQDISQKIDSDKYTEALCMYNMEQQNFQKLMTDVIYTNEDTYPVYVDLATTAFPVITRFVGGNGNKLVDSFSFIEQVLDLTRRNKEELDEAFVTVTYANVLTNFKGNFKEGEKSYTHSISVMEKFEVPNCLMKLRAHQGLGWNLGCQGKSAEALSVLKKALQYEKEMGMENEELMLQTLGSLGIFNTYAGFLDEGEIYHLKVLQKRRDLYGTDEHPSIGACLNNMGILYRFKGDYSKALEYYQLGLDIKRKTKATDKAIVLSINNVAVMLSELGRHDEGIEMLEEAFEIVNKYTGFITDCCDLTNDTFGQIYLHKKDYTSAVKYYKRGLKGRSESSPNHICVLEEKLRIAQAYIGMKKYQEAKTSLVDALKNKDEFIKQMQLNLFVYDSYKTLMEISHSLGDRTGMEINFTYCKAELYRLINFFEDLGNLTRSKEMMKNLKSVEKIYRELCRGRRG